MWSETGDPEWCGRSQSLPGLKFNSFVIDIDIECIDVNYSKDESISEDAPEGQDRRRDGLTHRRRNGYVEGQLQFTDQGWDHGGHHFFLDPFHGV